MVVLHHAGFALSWGDTVVGSTVSPARWAVVCVLRQMDLGVPLFFVISGYCIAASLDGHRRRGASSWEFLARRLRRIYPPYWAALLVFVVTVGGLDRLGLGWLHANLHSLELDPPGKLLPAQWLGNITLTETWRPKVWPGPPASVYTRVAWSLCYEEQFYLVSFAALLVAPRRLFGVLAVATVVIVGYRAFAYDSGRLGAIDGTFPYLWHEFAAGLAVYWRLVRATSVTGRRAVDAALVALLAVGLASGYRSTAVASAFALVLIALRDQDEAAIRARWLRPLSAAGRRCYSIYLIHLPVCTVGNEWLFSMGLTGFWTRALVMVPLVSAASLAAGWAFFAVVESRFLNQFRTRPTAAVFLPPSPSGRGPG
jgi:peptidoglycan/LPS O-acetylase OafA/YrhL